MLSLATLHAQEAEKFIQSGNDYYSRQLFDRAAESYNKALQKMPSNSIARFNLAATLYRQNHRDDAIKAFGDLATTVKDQSVLSKTFYNEGAILSKQNKTEQSVAAYENALRNDPNDIEARENLQKALLELKKRNPPKQPKEKPSPKKKNEDRQQQQPKMSQQEAQQRLKLLEQKEKDVQQRLQQDKAKTGSAAPKDW